MLRDVRDALRALLSWRGGAVAAVATLAVGIGAATTLNTFLRVALSSATADIEDAAAVGRIFAASPALGVERSQVTLGDLKGLHGAASFEAIGAYIGGEMTLGSGLDGDTVAVTRISPSFFTVLRAKPAAGRLFTDADFEAAAPVVLLSESTWRRRFPGRAFDGLSSVTLDGVERRVVGLVQAAIDFPFIGISGDAWIPLASDDADSRRTVSVIARLGPGRTWKAASAELSSLSPPRGRDGSWGWRAIPIHEDTRYRTVSAMAGTLVPALVVLVIACVNVSCMLLARGIAREMELTVRAALGATRGALVRQLVTEHLLLAVAGGMGGAAIAFWGIRSVAALFDPSKPFIAQRMIGDVRLLPIALGSAVIACLLFGTLPAIRLSRCDITSSLKGITSPGRVRVAGYGARDLVVFFELAVAVVLVVVTAMWLSFFSVLLHATPSFPATEVVVDRLAARDAPAVTERVRGVPGVEAVAIASGLPGRARVPTMVRADNGRMVKGAVVEVGESFLQTIGLPIVRGRSFDRTETGSDAGVVLSESVAAALWQDADAVGREVYIGDGSRSTRLVVVGVSRNALEFGGLGVLTAGDVYRPIDLAVAGDVVLFARTRQARSALRSIAAAISPSPGSQMPKPSTLSEALVLAPPESVSLVRLFSVFALVALLLAGSGIFGVISQSVAQRTTEFGVRMAMGASPGRVLRLVIGREARLILAAIACGTIGTVVVTRTLFAELVTMSALNPAWPVALIALCGVIAAIAVALATYRVVRLDPWVVLRRT